MVSRSETSPGTHIIQKNHVTMDGKTHRIFTKWIIPLFIGFTTSCSVKENRWICPCHLIFQAEKPEDLSREGGITLTVFEGESKELSQAFSWRSIRDDDYTAAVSKGEKNMSIIMNKDKGYIVGTRLMIKEGEQADSIWASSVRASCIDDVCTIPVGPKKQHACVFISMTGYKEEDYPFIAQVVGNTCGFDLISLQPVRGAYSHEATICREGHLALRPNIQREMSLCGYDRIWDASEVKYSLILPRQVWDDDSGLYLNLKYKSDNTNNYKPIVLALGKIITKTGYDWSDADLKDIFITLDFVNEEGQIVVKEWESGWKESITI